MEGRVEEPDEEEDQSFLARPAQRRRVISDDDANISHSFQQSLVISSTHVHHHPPPPPYRSPPRSPSPPLPPPSRPSSPPPSRRASSFISYDGLEDEAFWIRWRQVHPGATPGRDMFRWRSEVDMELLQDYRNYAASPHDDTEEKRRIRHWIHLDMQNQWCFLCESDRSTSSSQRFRDYYQIKNFAANNLSQMSPVRLYEILQNMYEIDVVPKQHRMNLIHFREGVPVPLDKLTGQPRPVHYWSKHSIHRHFTEHTSDTRVSVEYKIKEYAAISTYLASKIIIPGSETDGLAERVDKDAIKWMLEVDKSRQSLERQRLTMGTQVSHKRGHD